MATSQAWRLKRFGRLVPGSGETGSTPWKVRLTAVYLILAELNYANDRRLASFPIKITLAANVI